MTTPDADRLLQRLTGLLAKAESTDNEAEAEAYLMKAQEISTRYSIDLATARARATFKNHAAQPLVCETVVIGERGKRGLGCYVLLCTRIARANSLKCSILSNSTEVYLYGFREDIDVALKLYGSLAVQMARASENYLNTGTYKTEDVWHEVTLLTVVGLAERIGCSDRQIRTAVRALERRELVVITKGSGGWAGMGEYGKLEIRRPNAPSWTRLDWQKDCPTALVVERGDPWPGLPGHVARVRTEFVYAGMPVGLVLFVWLPDRFEKHRQAMRKHWGVGGWNARWDYASPWAIPDNDRHRR